jgi:Uma2 family endonuclease
MSSATRATVEDLYRTEGKAELIRGRIVEYMATGNQPSQVGGNIYASLREQVKRSRRGVPYTDSVGFIVAELPSGRESFCPDASYYEGPLPTNPMRFVDGPPTFAAAVRSENGYGPAAEEALAEKRTDYFAVGTLIVWDVDPRAERVLVYRPTEPGQPTIYIRGQVAEAEPAVPGWRMPVDDVFWLAPGTP